MKAARSAWALCALLCFTSCHRQPEIEPAPVAYTIVETKDNTLFGDDARRRYVRKSLRITVPKGMSRNALEATVQHAARRARAQYDAEEVMVFAYAKGDNVYRSYTAARCMFAPYGQWGALERVKDYYRFFTVDYNEAYFRGEPPVLGVGTEVTLFRKQRYDRRGKSFVSASTTDLYRTPDNWTEENLAVRVPNGTRAVVLDSKKQLIGEEYLVQYRVKSGKAIGWVNAAEMRSSP